jgi:hypothetical protein
MARIVMPMDRRMCELKLLGQDGCHCFAASIATAGLSCERTEGLFRCELKRLAGSCEMSFDGHLTKCTNCKSPLAWQSHVKRWEQASELQEFTFLCNSCKREYMFKDDKFIEKELVRDPLAQTLAVNHSELLVRRRAEII